MRSETKKYPDVSRIFAAKERRRQVLTALSWEEKVAIVEWMRASMPKGRWNAGLSDT
jgi:hypothetical protein